MSGELPPTERRGKLRRFYWRDVFWLLLAVGLTWAWLHEHVRVRRHTAAIQATKQYVDVLPLKTAQEELRLAEAEFAQQQILRLTVDFGRQEYRRAEFQRNAAKIELQKAQVNAELGSSK
ncbi:hypothetical protein [Anatilimnocola floriformis]|uniref:hypothetical protein n=1 Tax=Anatilimnocola floriformis TaxID=2948575 RepID=UPI0020C2414E|nr:hypothetical protein [Anatilimnocola floriformis]